MEANLWMIPAAGALALVFAYVKSAWINKQSAGNETMSTIANNIREGAMAFLSAEYKKLAIFVAVVAVLLAYANNGRTDSHALSQPHYRRCNLFGSPDSSVKRDRSERPDGECGAKYRLRLTLQHSGGVMGRPWSVSHFIRRTFPSWRYRHYRRQHENAASRRKF